MSAQGNAPKPERAKLMAREFLLRYLAIIPFLAILGFYAYIFDFTYSGNVSAPLPTPDSGLLCKLEFDNLKETYDSFVEFYAKLAGKGGPNDIYRTFTAEETRDLIYWGKPQSDLAWNPPKQAGAKWRALDPQALGRFIGRAPLYLENVNRAGETAPYIGRHKVELLDRYGLSRAIRKQLDESPIEFIRKNEAVFGHGPTTELKPRCLPHSPFSIGIWPKIWVDTQSNTTGEYEPYLNAAIGLRLPDYGERFIRVHNRGNGIGRQFNITILARSFGLLIAAVFLLCCAYFAAFEGSNLVGYVVGTRLPRANRWHTSFVDFAFIASLIVAAQQWLVCSWVYAFSVAVPLISLCVFRCLAECAPSSWSKPIFDFMERSVVRNIGKTVFEPAGMIFPLIGILGTFLGLALALADQGLLHILRTLSDGNAMPASEWVGLLKGVGAAIFSSLFATFSAIMARFAGGCFGLEREESQKVEITKVPPHGSYCKPCPSQEDACAKAPPSQPVSPSASDAPAPLVPPSPPSGGPGSLDPQATAKLEKIAEGIASLTFRIDSIASHVDELRFQSRQAGSTLAQGRDKAVELIKMLQSRTKRLLGREPKFTRLTEALEAVQNRLNEGPISLLSSIERDRAAGLEQMKELVKEARTELREGSTDIIERGTAIASQLQRLVSASERLQENAQAIADAQKALADQVAGPSRRRKSKATRSDTDTSE